MGEKIQAAKLEFGETEKRWEAAEFSAIFPVLNSAISAWLEALKKTQGQGLKLSMHWGRD